MANNKNLTIAAKAKKDEFYTRISDIENELRHYRPFFKDKVVLCNCDDPYESEFFRHFALMFNVYGLKKLIATCYDGSPILNTEINLFDPPVDKKAYKVEITEIIYDPDRGFALEELKELVKDNATLLKGNGDFRSDECIELLKQADVVVTNPPFSLFREFVTQLIQYDKKFLIIGNQNAITYKEIFPLFMNNKIWLGYGFNGGNAYLRLPNGEYKIFADGVYNSETGLVKFRNLYWFTNLDVRKRHEDIPLWENFTPEKYPKYDNYDAIEVAKVSDIPEDYYGVMGVPITFMDKYNPAQFEIIGIAKRGAGDPALRTRVYAKEDYPNYSDLNAGPVLIKNGVPKNTYPRILIRRRQ